jgi:NAD(P)-dependent dehydrogenase (short-subunit alcohol dehydrogenase family)
MATMSGLSGRVALITGGASGIGAALTRHLRAAGATVVVADLAEPPADLGADLTVRLDVSRWEEWEPAVARVEEALGHLDLVFLNAGLAAPPPASLERLSVPDYQRVVGVNLHGVVYGAKATLPALRRAGGGALVATASLAGLTGIPGDPVYTLTKHAVVGLVRSLGPALAGEGITVAAVCPGFTDTPLLAPVVSTFHAHDFPLLSADDVAVAGLAAISGPPGACWLVQPGRTPEPYQFRGVPSARQAGQTVRVPDEVIGEAGYIA